MTSQPGYEGSVNRVTTQCRGCDVRYVHLSVEDQEHRLDRHSRHGRVRGNRPSLECWLRRTRPYEPDDAPRRRFEVPRCRTDEERLSFETGQSSAFDAALSTGGGQEHRTKVVFHELVNCNYSESQR